MATEARQQFVPLRAISLSLDDIKRIYERLSRHLADEANIQIQKIQKPADHTESQFRQAMDDLRNNYFKIEIIITAPDGAKLTHYDGSIFDSPNIPDSIASIYFTNRTAFQNLAKVPPPNSFDLNLDFSKPPLLDPQNPLSTPTPNHSGLQVSGDRDAWIAAITDAVTGITDNRKTRRKPIHGPFVYDIGLLLFAVPCVLYACWKLSGFVSAYLEPINSFVSTIAYIYIALIVVFAYRILFGYTKWAFPTVELTDNRDASSKHRGIWSAIILGLVVNFIYDIST